MREELKHVIKEVRRNEAVIEYLYLKDAFPQSVKVLGDVTNEIIAQTYLLENAYGYSSAQ
jgi:hypothetical protein